jgi:LCP family protein required for cell wall assembly
MIRFNYYVAETGVFMSSVIKSFVVTFCVSLLIFGLMSYAIVTNVDNVFSSSDTDTADTGQTSGPSETAPDSGTVTANTPQTDTEGNIIDSGTSDTTKTPADNSFTVLLVGTDYQPDILNDYDVAEKNKGITGFPIKAREITADSIMLIKIDSETKEFVFSMLPSNMKVQTDGNDVKLGSLYSSKGIDYLRDKVTAMTGMPIDYYAVVPVGGLAAIIDELGGISFTVRTDMNYEDESQQLSIHIPKGSRMLSGTDAVNMLRYRSYPDGDTSRRALISTFAGAILKKLTDPSYLAQANSLYTSASQYVETDFTLTDLTIHLELIFSYPEFTTTDLTYPGTAAGSDTYFEPDLTAAIKLYRSYR